MGHLRCVTPHPAGAMQVGTLIALAVVLVTGASLLTTTLVREMSQPTIAVATSPASPPPPPPEILPPEPIMIPDELVPPFGRCIDPGDRIYVFDPYSTVSCLCETNVAAPPGTAMISTSAGIYDCAYTPKRACVYDDGSCSDTSEATCRRAYDSAIVNTWDNATTCALIPNMLAMYAIGDGGCRHVVSGSTYFAQLSRPTSLWVTRNITGERCQAFNATMFASPIEGPNIGACPPDSSVSRRKGQVCACAPVGSPAYGTEPAPRGCYPMPVGSCVYNATACAVSTKSTCTWVGGTWTAGDTCTNYSLASWLLRHAYDRMMAAP